MQEHRRLLLVALLLVLLWARRMPFIHMDALLLLLHKLLVFLVLLRDNVRIVTLLRHARWWRLWQRGRALAVLRQVRTSLGVHLRRTPLKHLLHTTQGEQRSERKKF